MLFQKTEKRLVCVHEKRSFAVLKWQDTVDVLRQSYTA